MELARTWRLLMASRWSFLLLVLAATAAAVGISYAVPERYLATTLILVRPHEKLRLDQRSSDKEILNYPVSPLAPVDVPSRTYIEVIKSDALAERVVRSLDLDKPKALPEESALKRIWRQSKEWLAGVASDAWQLLKYGRLSERDPVEVAVDSLKRNLSLNAIKDTYLFQIAYKGRDPQEAAAVANMLATMFVEYLTTTDRSESQANRVFLEHRVESAAEAVTTARANLQRFKDEQATFALEEEYKSRLTTIGDLQARLAQVDARLQGLLKTLTPAHPTVQATQAERDRLRQSLAALESRRDPLAAKENELADLELRLEILEGDYSVVSKALAEARIQEENQANDVRVVSVAEAPTFPVAPIKIYYAAAGASLALVLGVFVILMADALARRVRCIDDARSLGVPVLATFPSIASRKA